MSYPLSSEVSAGDATLASHYNNLRSDGLFLGHSSADAVALAALLERFESRLEISRLDTDRLRVSASAVEPVSLMLAGYMLQAVANVDLAAEAKPSGAAAVYYIFANRADSSTTFTLSVSTSSTEGANQRRIGQFYWDGSKIEQDSIQSELSMQIKSLLYYVEPQICEGRLTLSTGVSAPTSDVSASSNLYYTPHSGNRISLFVPGYGWRLYTFSELTLDLSAVATDKNLDIWIYDNAGTLTLAYTEWSNDSLRATAITRQDGIYCKSGALNYRYLGTVRTSAAGEVCDTREKRFVWNYKNQVERVLFRHDDTEEWTYNAREWRPWNNDTANRVQFVIGVDELAVDVLFKGGSKGNNGRTHGISIGLDSITAPSDDAVWGAETAADHQSHSARYIGYPGIGYHYLQMLEYAYESTTITFYGSIPSSVNYFHSALCGSIKA